MILKQVLIQERHEVIADFVDGHTYLLRNGDDVTVKFDAFLAAKLFSQV